MNINPPRYFDLSKLATTLGVHIGGVYDPSSTHPALLFTELHTYDAEGMPMEFTPAQQQTIAATNDPLPSPPTPPPNIAGLISALAASPSIDQTTKDKLTAALRGA